MAKLEGVLKLVGTLQGLTIIKTKDGYIVKKKSSMNAARIKKDPAYKAIREHQAEFGACAKAAKLLRDTLMPVLENCLDNRMTPRLNKLMNSIKNLDVVSPPGKRNVTKGLMSAGGPGVLKGFNFNARSNLAGTLLASCTIDQRTAKVVFKSFDPDKHIPSPKGATHVALHCGLAGIDFRKKTSELMEDSILLPLKPGAQRIVLDPGGKFPAKNFRILVLKVVFLQLVNDNHYEMTNSAFNAAEIAEVWVPELKK